jgi:recombination protein RecT
MSNNTQLTREEQKVMDTFEVQSIKEQVNDLLAGNLSKISKFKTTICKLSLNWGLKDCTPESIINCGLQALSMNLPLQGGQGYVVNYDGHAAFDVGFKGWQVLAKRAGQMVYADPVYKCDDFYQDGYGMNRQMNFKPDHDARKSSDDKWATDNLVGVIVSVVDIETKQESVAFVPAEKIFKIQGKSPSIKTEKGRKHSPHTNWAEEMFNAKAIKYVLSKYPIDISEASELQDAIDYTNQTEQMAQAQAQAETSRQSYTDEQFGGFFTKWADLVRNGKKSAAAIIRQITLTKQLTSDQYDQLQNLHDLEPIEGEVAHAE